MMPLLEIRHLVKHFGGTLALDDFSASIPTETIVGLIGPNGCGKTTLFNAVCGFVRPDSGKIILQDYPILGRRPEIIAQMGVARTFQNLQLVKTMTVMDHILLSAQEVKAERLLSGFIDGGRRADARVLPRAREIAEFVGLWASRDLYAGELSYGQMRLLALGCALALPFKILLLDEPFAGLSVSMVEEVMKMLRFLKQRGTTMVIIEHNLDALLSLCDEIIVMDEGRNVTQGTPSALRQDGRVVKAYFS